MIENTTGTTGTLDEEVVGRWSIALQEARADAMWTERWEREKRFRETIRPHLLDLLQRFRDGATPLPQVQTTFDAKTRKEWDIFGLKGTSGAMFFNMMIKHLPNQEALDARLRAALPVPVDSADGQRRMSDFLAFLSGCIDTGLVAKRQIQTARVPFFLSAWWHTQQPEEWPIFYASARRVLERESRYRENRPGALVETYLAYRQMYHDLARALDLSTWDFEGLCLWRDDHPQDRSDRPPGFVNNGDGATRLGTRTIVPPLTSQDPSTPTPDQTEDADDGTAHSQAQWLLAQIGKRLGCRIWIARNDRGKTWQGQRLGDLSIDHLPPLGIGTAAQKVVELIDVLWLRGGNQVVAAFEVEHSTSVYSGLLRMSDLTVLSPNLNFRLFIAAPESRLDKVRRELARPTFPWLDLHKRCGFFSMEKLARDTPHIMEFATAPSVIDVLAERVGDNSEEDNRL